MKKYLIIFLLVMVFLGSMVYLGTRNVTLSTDSPVDDATRQLEEQYLRAALSEALIKYAHIEIAQIESVDIVQEVEGDSLALNLFQDNKKLRDRVRAEISIDYPYNEGETLRYSWQFKLPEVFPSDFPLNRWWVIGQWHDQPDISKGETWDGHESQSPPVLFGYGNDGKDDILSFTYGTTHTPIGTIPLKKNVWNTITIDITWSQSDMGKAVVYLNGLDKPIFVANGANMLNGYQHYMKIGQYRHSDIATDNTVYVRNVAISKK